MNLCFSIVTLLLAKAYIALTIAGLKEPLSGWRYACTGAWLLVLTNLIALAAGAANLRRCGVRTRFGRLHLCVRIAHVVADSLVGRDGAAQRLSIDRDAKSRYGASPPLVGRLDR